MNDNNLYEDEVSDAQNLYWLARMVRKNTPASLEPSARFYDVMWFVEINSELCFDTLLALYEGAEIEEQDNE